MNKKCTYTVVLVYIMCHVYMYICIQIDKGPPLTDNDTTGLCLMLYMRPV